MKVTFPQKITQLSLNVFQINSVTVMKRSSVPKGAYNKNLKQIQQKKVKDDLTSSHPVSSLSHNASWIEKTLFI